MGQSEDCPEKIGTLKKGEKIFLIPVYIVTKIFRKINSFANKPTTIFFICLITIREIRVSPIPFIPSFDEMLPILLERNADCFIVAY
jgi:hypothetical protein